MSSTQIDTMLWHIQREDMILNDHLDNEGNIIAKCAWFSRQGNSIETSSKDFCSFGCIRPKGGEMN